MAVNGFLVDNEVQKYNYESLENYNTPDFSVSSTYQVGDYVMYQGKLYKCTTAITTGGGWDSSKWSLAILSDDVANLRNSVESGEYGLSEPVKQAILQIARKVAYIDDQGQTYYDDLYDALYPLNIVSISAVYTQSGTVYDTDTLDSLKTDLVVTATYSDSSTETVPAADYTLSGTLTAGTSTITVSYGGKTTTFDVTVTQDTTLYEWDFTESLLDKKNGVEAVVSNVTRDSAGCHLSASSGSYTGSIRLGSTDNPVFQRGRTISIKFGQVTASFSGNTGSKGSRYGLPNGQVIMAPIVLAWRGSSDKFFDCTSSWSDVYQSTDPAYFNNKTLEIVTDVNGGASVYVDDSLFGTLPSGTVSEASKAVVLGGWNGQTYYNMTVESVKVVASE